MRVLQDGSESEVLHRGPTWNFLNINSAKAARYCCTAYNGVEDPVKHTLTVNVLCKYIIIQVVDKSITVVWLSGFKGSLHHAR